MYSVDNGQIIPNAIYKVIGDKNVIYADNEYHTGEFFRGIDSFKEFVFAGDGIGFLTEISEINSGAIFFKQPHHDLSFPVGATVISGMALQFKQTHSDLSFPLAATGINGMAIQFKLTEAEKVVNEVTKLLGMSITFKDYPSHIYIINETRFSFNPD